MLLKPAARHNSVELNVPILIPLDPPVYSGVASDGRLEFYWPLGSPGPVHGGAAKCSQWGGSKPPIDTVGVLLAEPASSGRLCIMMPHFGVPGSRQQVRLEPKYAGARAVRNIP